MGEYEPKTFEVGDIVTASDLNKMNQQIIANSKKPVGSYVRYDVEDQGLTTWHQLFARNNIDAAQKNKLIRITGEYGNWTANITFAELYESHKWDESRPIFLYIEDDQLHYGALYQLVDICPEWAHFVCPFGLNQLQLTFYANDTIVDESLFPSIQINDNTWIFIDEPDATVDLTDTINAMIDAKIEAALANLTT